MISPRIPKTPSRSAGFQSHVEGIEYEVLNNLVGYAVRRAQIAVYEDFFAVLASEGITPQRFSALVIISKNPGITPSVLAEVMGIARSGVVSLLETFVDMGLVVREEFPENRRSYHLCVTVFGKEKLKAYRKAVKAHDDRISKALSPVERKQLITLLGKIGIPKTN